ncbi:hypothetical protein EPA93_45480 [Ktedonosporobacter rubrisoli]|uniref:Lantibiotic dehydratase N-terminal domain-containing protein n=1 Tax=Ktedonosporobacter rubrisoli TaxID=2509675 RepID=A0A4P6K4H6_KTERU|nr:lantibiotic dehydratase [Ktedonosporobacter rubrisoli]QBD82833.1 hypothetical protein EPA93_45480 [Ktedonosporobacter rubrisoli]
MGKYLIQPEKSDFRKAITSCFLLRVCGLPINLVARLHFDETLQWQEAVLAFEEHLTERKESVVDALYHCVSLYKEQEQKALRRKVINLKRDIYNLDLPVDISSKREIADALPPDIQTCLNDWLDLWVQYQQQLRCGTTILEQELRQKRHLFKEFVNEEDFRKGLFLSSPLLDLSVETYLAGDNLYLSRGDRTVERSLLKYFFRAACKTSPFSTFTSVCTGSIENGYANGESRQPITLQMQDMRKTSFTQLNMVILSRISEQLLNCSEIRDMLHVQITNGWQIQDGRLTYVRRKSSSIENLGPMDRVQENLIQLPLSQLLKDLLSLMEDGAARPLAQIIAHLCTYERYYKAEKAIGEYLQHLLRLGFLIVPALQIDIHHSAPLNAYCERLETIGAPLTDSIAHDLRLTGSLVHDFACALADKRRTIREEIRNRLEQCLRKLHATDPKKALPERLLYEDTILASQQLLIHEQGWKELFSQLEQLQQLLPLFESSLPEKLITRGYFQARYGIGQRCEDVFAFANTYIHEFKGLQWQEISAQRAGDSENEGHDNYFQSPEIDQLNSARKAVTTYLQQSYDLSSHTKDLLLEDDFFHTIVPLIPDIPDEFRSHTIFSQFAKMNEEPSLIINHIYSGMATMFTRFLHYFSHAQSNKLASTLRKTLERLETANMVFAEMKGGYEATNLNVHPILTRYELVCPGETSLRPTEEQIPLHDLSIQDDCVAGRLRLYSKRLHKEIVPLYLGLLAPFALPATQQILLLFSPQNICNLNLWNGIKLAQTDASRSFYPRLRYKNIVLQRAMWEIVSEAFPQRMSGQSDADFYLTISRWRKKMEIPAQVFMTAGQALSTSDTFEAEDQLQGEEPFLLSHKPLYIDFENYQSILHLESIVQRIKGSIRLWEMLPGLEQQWFKHENQSYVSEFVLEINRSKSVE